VDGPVNSDDEVRKLMMDREAWRRGIKMIVAANKEVDSRRINARSAIVVI
jgi:hypothetical protein